ncbi:hypothetical protein RRG08_063505, partial [Elysia crispata]
MGARGTELLPYAVVCRNSFLIL